MKATLNLTENTILMDCTPQELAGLLSLLQPCPKQALPSSDHHPDEPPAPAEPVQDPEPSSQAPEPAPADHDLEQDPEPALQAPEPAPAEPVQDPEPSSKEPEPVIPPEPAEREPLGKAIERLKKEKTAGRPMKYQPVYARNDDGDTIYRDSVFELALALDVTAQTVHQAIKKGYRCKGYKIKFDDPKTPLL